MDEPAIETMSSGGKTRYSSGCRLTRLGLGHSRVQAGLIYFTQPNVKKSFNQGLYLSLSGAGCRGIDFARFVLAIKYLNPHITRVDLAIDYYDGLVTYEQIKRFYFDGYFSPIRGSSPQHKTHEPLDTSGNKKDGFTFEIGKRGAAKFVRAYEKGLAFSAKQNSIFSTNHGDWFRLEFELRSVAGYEIPLHFIDNIDGFFLGLYPRLFEFLPIPTHSPFSKSTSQPVKMSFHEMETQIHLSKAIHHCKRAYGKYINAMLNHLNYSPEKIVDLLKSDENVLPKRLQLPVSNTY